MNIDRGDIPGMNIDRGDIPVMNIDRSDIPVMNEAWRMRATGLAPPHRRAHNGGITQARHERLGENLAAEKPSGSSDRRSALSFWSPSRVIAGDPLKAQETSIRK
jgi:hypothetical protein